MIQEDWSIDFTNKKITHRQDGSGALYTVRELYSYLQDVFDRPETMKYDIPIAAQSVTEFSLINGWTIDEASRHFLSEGTLHVY